MKRLRITISVAFASLAFALCAQPQITWLATTHDFGVINENDGEAICEFFFVNTGDEPLTIIKARASCGCTTPVYPYEPIAPGDTSVVKVSYDPVGRPGRFKKNVYIDINTADSRSTLQVSGVVIAAEQTVKMRYPVEAGPLRLRRALVALGEVYKGKSKTEFLDAYNVSRDTVYPRFENVPEYYSVMSAPKAVPPGEQVTFTFYFNAHACPTWGRVADTIAIVPATGVKPVDILSVAIVEEDFSRLTPGERMNAPAIAISTQRIDLGEITATSGIITHEVKIENFGKRALQLRRVYCDVPGVKVSIDKDKLKKGKSTKALITIDPSKVEGEYLNAHVTIISNDPQRPTSVVRVTAEIKQSQE